jgi:transposase-like protein
LIAAAYLAGTNTRRVRRALKALFAEGIGKDVVSRVWRKVRSDWEAWNARALVPALLFGIGRAEQTDRLDLVEPPGPRCGC